MSSGVHRPPSPDSWPSCEPAASKKSTTRDRNPAHQMDQQGTPVPRKGQNPSQGRRAGSTPTAHRVQVTYLIISAAGTAPEVTNGDQVESDATVAEDRHGDSIRIEALPDAEIHNPNLTRLVLKGGDMYTGCRFRASSSSPVPERPPETKRSRRNRLRERVASLSPSFNCSRGRIERGVWT